MRGQGKATATRATKGLAGHPGWRKLRSEVLLEAKLELNDGSRGIPGSERTGKVRDRLSESDSEGSGSGDRGHCDS